MLVLGTRPLVTGNNGSLVSGRMRSIEIVWSASIRLVVHVIDTVEPVEIIELEVGFVITKAEERERRDVR